MNDKPYVATGFEGVRAQFDRNFIEHHEIGAAICVYRHGECVVDLWGGVADPTTQAPWLANSLINTFSVTKGIVAFAVLELEDQGLIDLDVPVTTYWPAFGTNGKEGITLRQILNHRSGVVAIDRPLSLDACINWDGIDDAIINQAPRWAPGSDQGYHAITWGLLVRSIVQRATGRCIGECVNALAQRLSADVYLGVPDDKLPQCATLVSQRPVQAVAQVLKRLTEGGSNGPFFRNTVLRPRSDGARAVANPAALGARGFQNYNLDAVRQAVLPWTNVNASARGLARMYAPLAMDGEAFGVRVVSEAAAARPKWLQSWSERDRVMRKPLGFAQGFLKEQPGVFAPTTTFFGHPGTGGCLVFADPKYGISVGYVMNRLRSHVRSPTAVALSKSIYAALDG